ncbi:TlpA disulfide reductase family protein [Aquimarina pacifica]|uniref:TlpA disulfide reductase family protein n=1 Tax=Aquimarina pacifica TaxID=1296415 RepID=UPI00046FA400|nr:TlpA disulfide reductase family protein [Aquimarina pacifica]
MKKIFPIRLAFIVFASISFYSCKYTEKPKNDQEVVKNTIQNQKNTEVNTIKTLDFKELEPLLHTKSDTTYVVNFWATWCAPCVKELPFFETYNQKNKDQKVKVLLVSLDFAKDIEKRLLPFIEKRNIQSEVVLLDDGDANSWIDKVDPNWSGALPFTLVFNSEKRNYFERSFESLEDLEKVIDETIL